MSIGKSNKSKSKQWRQAERREVFGFTEKKEKRKTVPEDASATKTEKRN